jgi:hypothetical protein
MISELIDQKGKEINIGELIKQRKLKMKRKYIEIWKEAETDGINMKMKMKSGQASLRFLGGNEVSF